MPEIEQELIDILDAHDFIVREIAEPFVIEVVADRLTSNRFAFTLEEKIGPTDT